MCRVLAFREILPTIYPIHQLDGNRYSKYKNTIENQFVNGADSKRQGDAKRQKKPWLW